MQKSLAIFFLMMLTLWLAYTFVNKEPQITGPHPASGRIICFGDSLTYGTGAGTNMSYPAQLSRLLGRPVKNFGKPGATTESALHLLPADVMRQMPAMVLITLGGNDLKNGVAKETAMTNLEQIITSIHQAGGLAVVGGIKLPFLDKGYSKGYREVCKKTGAVLVEDILGGIMGKPDLMSDQIHPNDQGYRIIAARFQAAITPYL